MASLFAKTILDLSSSYTKLWTLYSKAYFSFLSFSTISLCLYWAIRDLSSFSSVSPYFSFDSLTPEAAWFPLWVSLWVFLVSIVVSGWVAPIVLFSPGIWAGIAASAWVFGPYLTFFFFTGSSLFKFSLKETYSSSFYVYSLFLRNWEVSSCSLDISWMTEGCPSSKSYFKC